MIQYYKYFLWLKCAMDLFDRIRFTNNISLISKVEVEGVEAHFALHRLSVFVTFMGFQAVNFAQKVTARKIKQSNPPIERLKLYYICL